MWPIGVVCLALLAQATPIRTREHDEVDLHASGLAEGNVKVRDCEPIRIKECQGLGYNHTGMPNLVQIETQADAQLQYETFRPLIQYSCSSELRLFLCSVYVPMCTEKVLEPIGPCRSLCERVRRACNPILEQFSYSWPALLDCDNFPPANNERHMCMEGPGSGREGDEAGGPRGGRRPNDPDGWAAGGASGSIPPDRAASCRHLRNADSYVYVNETGRCALLCGADDLFTADDKRFADVWMSIWTGLCLASTVFTALTFVVDPTRFRYPERPIVFLSVCYGLQSLAFVVRLIAGRRTISCHPDPEDGRGTLLLLIQDGLDNTNCALVFVLLYYFGTASAIWWLVLALTWFLSAGLKWGQEAIERHGTRFHLAAWTLPALQTAAALGLRLVDADELTGLCQVGGQRQDALLAFVLVPELVYLSVGASFLLAGLANLFRIRRHVRNDGLKTERLERLIIRIGLFSVLYTVPAACVAACHLYEYANRASWHRPDGTGDGAIRTTISRPRIEIFMLKIFMSLVVGVTSGMWVWSAKTLYSWTEFCRRLATGKRGPAQRPLGPTDRRPNGPGKDRIQSGDRTRIHCPPPPPESRAVRGGPAKRPLGHRGQPLLGPYPVHVHSCAHAAQYVRADKLSGYKSGETVL